MNKASFEHANKHRKIMYPAVTKPKIACQKPFRPKKSTRLQTSEKLMSTSPSKHLNCSSNETI